MVGAMFLISAFLFGSIPAATATASLTIFFVYAWFVIAPPVPSQRQVAVGLTSKNLKIHPSVHGARLIDPVLYWRVTAHG